jgi:CheY-like chemotaxis protein
MTTSPDPERPRRILVVEDDRSVLEMACALLGRAGYETVAASSAEQGLALALAEPFDAVLCDVVLPQRSGLDLAEELGASLPALPVLLTSGQEQREVRDAISSAGLPFLPKPYTDRGLQDALHALLAGGPRRRP